MRILVCVKRVPAPGARIVVGPDGRTIDTANLGYTMSPHEECAVEVAVQLVEQHGGTVTVMTLGQDGADEQLRYALSVGATDAILIPAGDHDWDPQATARALIAAIGDAESVGVFDLILFGNESADSGGYQVGVRVAGALARPMVTGIKGIEIDHGVITARRETDGGFELYQLPLPAAVGVKEGIALPRYPTLRGRLASKKADVHRFDVDEEPGGQSMVRLVSPPEQVTETVLLVDAAGIVDVMEELELL
ncbi:MAG: electron transfer flavoprotein subunit beta [Acidimicrobiia bacterium]|nr:MAG: electron transfer flavoprotein subunit beta [Acidimicrobiia bacterium]